MRTKNIQLLGDNLRSDFRARARARAPKRGKRDPVRARQRTHIKPYASVCVKRVHRDRA